MLGLGEGRGVFAIIPLELQVRFAAGRTLTNPKGLFRERDAQALEVRVRSLVDGKLRRP